MPLKAQNLPDFTFAKTTIDPALAYRYMHTKQVHLWLELYFILFTLGKRKRKSLQECIFTNFLAQKHPLSFQQWPLPETESQLWA